MILKIALLLILSISSVFGEEESHGHEHQLPIFINRFYPVAVQNRSVAEDKKSFPGKLMTSILESMSVSEVRSYISNIRSNRSQALVVGSSSIIAPVGDKDVLKVPIEPGDYDDLSIEISGYLRAGSSPFIASITGLACSFNHHEQKEINALWRKTVFTPPTPEFQKEHEDIDPDSGIVVDHSASSVTASTSGSSPESNSSVTESNDPKNSTRTGRAPLTANSQRLARADRLNKLREVSQRTNKLVIASDRTLEDIFSASTGLFEQLTSAEFLLANDCALAMERCSSDLHSFLTNEERARGGALANNKGGESTGSGGGKLKDVLHRFLLKLHYLMDAGEGLLRLHEMGLAHGDVKTSNVLLCRAPGATEFVARIADLAYSITYRTGVRNNSLVMVPADRRAYSDGHRAPECVYDNRLGAPAAPTPASDVYAFAVIIWETLVGVGKPFSHVADAETSLDTATLGGAKPYEGSEAWEKLLGPREAVMQIYQVVMACWHPAWYRRPTLHAILRVLSKAIDEFHDAAENANRSEL